MPAEPQRQVVHSTRIADMIITALVHSTPAWMHAGVCADSRVDHLDPDEREAALAQCARCPFAEQCLDYARTHQVAHGVWGGVVVDDQVGHGG